MNFDDKLEKLEYDYKGDGDIMYYHLDTLRSEFETVELIPDRLWAIKEDTGFLNICFLEWGMEDDDVFVTEVFRSCGPTGSLRECRHTNFPDKGYVFYMNKDYMVAALDYLSKYFDMD